MHRISAVKCKGKSPTYSKQTQSKSAPPKASSDVPSGAPKKKTRRGGKGKAKVHAIVSSALVPPSVTNRLQETHQVAAPVAAPVSVPIMASTTVGGPSHAPVESQRPSHHSSPLVSHTLKQRCLRMRKRSLASWVRKALIQ